MVDRCPNCDKPILPTDVVCWHCGYQLPRKASAATPKHQVPVDSRQTAAREQVGAPGDYDWRALAVYGLLTLVIVVALWLIMRSLSRQPILVSSADFDFGGQWVTVTDADLRYTLSIPTEWQWIDLAYGDQSELLSMVTARQAYINHALRPLRDLAGEVETVGLAVGARNLDEEQPMPFLLIAQSERLSGVEAQFVLDLVDDGSFLIADQTIDTHLAGQTQARFSVLDQPNAYQCRHLFVTGEGKPGYLVAGCAPQHRFATMQSDLDDILNSFQLLEY